LEFTLGGEKLQQTRMEIHSTNGRFRVHRLDYPELYAFQYITDGYNITFYLPSDVDNNPVLDSFILAAIEILGDQTKLLVQKAKEMGAPIDAEQQIKQLDKDLEKTKLLFKKSLE
jgi:hypothetical protein